MPRPPITRFSSLVVNNSPTNKNNGFYAPQLTTVQRDAIPATTLVNGAIIYNTTLNIFQLYGDGGWLNASTGDGNVVGPVGAVDSNIATFNGATGALIQDSGVSINRVPTPFQGAFRALSAPNVLVNAIGNLGHLNFVNGVGLIFVDSLMPVEFLLNRIGGDDEQVCSLFTGGLPSSSTTPSALVELQTTTGALLLSRLTTAKRDAPVFFPTPGMILYNVDTNKFNVRDDLGWKAIGYGDVVAPASSIDGNIAAFDGITGKLLKDSGVNSNTVYYPGRPTYLIDTYGQTNNFFAGTNAGNNTIGINNLGVGLNALSANTTGGNNTAVGFGSLYSNTTGGNNTAVGVNTLLANTTGGNNTAVGPFSLLSNTTGGNNIAVGVNTLSANTTGVSNTAVGNTALVANTTGGNNTAVGTYALYSNTTGGNNTAVGINAASNFSFYSQCTFVGTNADASVSGLVNATAIGYNTKVGSSNSIVLGAACFVGIGKATPRYSLHLGTDNSSIPLIYIENSAAPTPPMAAVDGIFSVGTGKPTFTSGTAQYTGTLVTAKTTGGASTAGTGTLNGVTGVTISTTAVTTSSIVLITRNNGSLGAPLPASVGHLSVASIVNNTSFRVFSTVAADTFSFRWVIINP